ncbi:MAG: class I SAM-dependent methyltransferase [Pseudomonadota bacterium]
MAKQSGPDLEQAYALETPEDSVRLYRDWAASYDKGFAAAQGYVYPARVAEVFRARARVGDAPVLDVGAGTGLLGAAVGRGEIDALDISPEMLEQAAAKGVYRSTIVGDLTQTLDLAKGTYGAVTSSGTFTLGHVGPEALGELLRVAKPGALFCLGINAAAFDKYGFGSTIAALVADGRITAPDYVRVRFYETADHDHADEAGYVTVFRKRIAP